MGRLACKPLLTSPPTVKECTEGIELLNERKQIGYVTANISALKAALCELQADEASQPIPLPSELAQLMTTVGIFRTGFVPKARPWGFWESFRLLFNL